MPTPSRGGIGYRDLAKLVTAIEREVSPPSPRETETNETPEPVVTV